MHRLHFFTGSQVMSFFFVPSDKRSPKPEDSYRGFVGRVIPALGFPDSLVTGER